MTLTLYGDFTDPASWYACLRADALTTAGVDVDWRAVAARRSVWVTPTPVDDDARARFAALEQWHRSGALPGEPPPPQAPATTPWPSPAVSGYAEAVGAGVGEHVRHLIFAAHWLGQDIGNLETLRSLLTVPIRHGDSRSEVLSITGSALTISGGPYTDEGYHRLTDWKTDYQALGSPALPTLIEDRAAGHPMTSGLAALDRLGELVTQVGAEIPRVNPYLLPQTPLSGRRVSHERPGLRACWWDA